MTHDDLQELLAAYALDAVEGKEAEEVEGHLTDCPRCRAELAGYREVAGLFAYSGGEAPSGVWDRITASMQAEPPPLRMDRIREGMVDRVGTAPAGSGPAVSRGTLAARTKARRRWSAGATGALAVAAAVAIVVLAVSVVNLHDRMRSLHNQATVPVATATMADVRKALASPGRRKVALASPGVGPGSHTASLRVVIEPDGTAFLYDAKLTPLPADRVYQLWGVVGDRRISYGLLGTDPRVEEFQAGTGVQQLAVTDEVATGVVRSTQPFTVSGSVNPPL